MMEEMDEWKNVRIDNGINGWVYKYMDGWTTEWKNKWLDDWINGWDYKWMDGYIDR